MPELPEVETTRLGITPHLVDKEINQVIVRERRLRWPVPSNLNQILSQHIVQNITRRGKYLLLHFEHGTLLIHLGMSGRLCITPTDTLVKKHDHIDLIVGKQCLRYTDPRRFGSFHWTDKPPMAHALLSKLGPEPLSKHFDAGYLYNQALRRKVNTKQLIMNSQLVVGVGNIYATEALFQSKISPLRPCYELSQQDCMRLVLAIKKILKTAITVGGTTLKDFLHADGKPGYFQQKLNAYGKAGQPCSYCHNPLENIKINQRATVYCPNCQI